MTDLLRRPAVLRAVLAAAWLGAALALVHLAQGSARPHRVDLHATLWAAALAAAVMAAAVWFGRGQRVIAVSAVGGVIVVLAALALVAAHIAHETGLVLVALGAFLAGISGAALRPGDLAPRDRLAEPDP